MLKIKKFFSTSLLALSVALSSTYAQADVIDTLEFGANFYLLESSTSTAEGDDEATTTYSVYSYDMTAGGTSVTKLFDLTETPSAFAYDGTNFFISAGNKLQSYTNSGTATFIRNLITDAKTIIDAGDYLIVLVGDNGNIIQTIDKTTSDVVDYTPRLPDPEDGFTIHDIFLDSGDNRIVIQLADSSDNDDDNQYMQASFTQATGDLGDLATIPAQVGLDAPTGIGEPFFLNELEMAMDSEGNVIDFSGTDAIFSHGDQTADLITLSHFITPSFNNATDSIIDFATDDATYAYFALTLDNECNTNASPGGSRIARWEKSGNFLDEDWDWTGYLEPRRNYYDTNNSIHTLATNGTNTFLFYGEGDALAVEVIDDSDFNYDFFPWRNQDYDPNNADMSNVRQSTSFAIDDTTIAMQIEDGCDHYVAFWDTTTNSFTGHTETGWFDAIDGAYVAALDRVFIAFTDGTDYWIRHLSASTPESQDSNKFAMFHGFGPYAVNLLVSAGDFLVVHYNNDGDDTLLSYSLSGDDDDDNTDIGTEVMALSDATTNDTVEDCCGTWTSAVYAEHNKIYYTNSDGLFAIDFNGTTGEFDADDNGVAQSPHYGAESIHAIADSPYMALSDDEEILFLDGQIYDTDTLEIIDSLSSLGNIGLFVGDTLYTYNSDTSSLETWELTDNGVIEASPDSTDLNGTISALLPIQSDGATVPLTLEQQDGELAITIDGETDSSSVVGEASAGGDGDDEGDGDSDSDSDSDSDTDSNTDTDSGDDCPAHLTCVQAPGGGGGGSINWLLLLGLSGLALRAHSKGFNNNI